MNRRKNKKGHNMAMPLIYLIFLFFLHIATTVQAGSVNFKGGTWTIHMKNGQTYKVNKVEPDVLDDGEHILIYTKPDGGGGFVYTRDVHRNDLNDLLKMLEAGTYVPQTETRLSDTEQGKDERLKQEQSRLQQEINQREKDLQSELQNMRSGGSGLPYFSINKYCKEVSEVVGGSYSIEQGCVQNENNDKRTAGRMHISSRIKKYCTEVSEVVGGSYSIFLGCVRNEMQAKKALY